MHNVSLFATAAKYTATNLVDEQNGPGEIKNSTCAGYDLSFSAIFQRAFFYRPVLKLSDDDSGTLRPDKSSGPAVRGSPSPKISVRSSLSSRLYL